MAGNTKNLGQVTGVYIGNTPPENIILIWYDNTPSQMRHKIYDPGLSQWVVLDQNVISLITYSELINIAKNVGLSIGQYFQIKDKGNALALAITTTKVQYDDELGNILIDDLGTNIQYHVTSSNLLVDDIAGVFDVVNKKLVFQFKEMVPDFTADDYIMGKVQRNNVWSLAKYRLSSFLSKVSGNSISWNGGFFFNFGDSLKGQLDKKGGVVAKDTYDTDMQKVNQDIANVGKVNQQIIDNANKAITDATSDTAIYDKKSPAIETGGAATDVATGDKLLTIIGKFQRYINSFKFATGIKLSKNFAAATEKTNVNNNDTVESAISKIKKWLDLLDYSKNIKVSDTDFPIVLQKPTIIDKAESVLTALSKLWYLVNNIDGLQLKNNIIDFSKIAKTGVLPTDIFRLELTTSFDFSGGAFGGVMVQGSLIPYFSQDDLHPYNPYRLNNYYNTTFPKILSFVPLIPVIPNVQNSYANASSLVHYSDGDARLQFIFQIPKSTFDTLSNASNTHFKCTYQANIYNNNTDQKIAYVAMKYVNIVNIILPKEALNTSYQQHIIFKLSIEPVQYNS